MINSIIDIWNTGLIGKIFLITFVASIIVAYLMIKGAPMTPCESKNYHPGDEFIVLSGDGIAGFSKDSKVRLTVDDGTYTPRFDLLDGYCSNMKWAHEQLRNVRKIK